MKTTHRISNNETNQKGNETMSNAKGKTMEPTNNSNLNNEERCLMPVSTDTLEQRAEEEKALKDVVIADEIENYGPDATYRCLYAMCGGRLVMTGTYPIDSEGRRTSGDWPIIQTYRYSDISLVKTALLALLKIFADSHVRASEIWVVSCLIPERDELADILQGIIDPVEDIREARYWVRFTDEVKAEIDKQVQKRGIAITFNVVPDDASYIIFEFLTDRHPFSVGDWFIAKKLENGNWVFFAKDTKMILDLPAAKKSGQVKIKAFADWEFLEHFCDEKKMDLLPETKEKLTSVAALMDNSASA